MGQGRTGEVHRADDGHSHQLAELDGGGEQAGHVGRPGRGHVHQGLREQRADRQSQAEAHRGQPGSGQGADTTDVTMQADRDAQVGDGADGQPGRDDDPAGRGGQPPPVVAGQSAHHHHRQVTEAGPPRALAEPRLQVQREGACSFTYPPFAASLFAASAVTGLLISPMSWTHHWTWASRCWCG
jgi:hypothetical protein